MSKHVVHRKHCPIVPEWRWRDKYGDRHLPAEMETRHLFHVVRMIWDHTMPPEFQTTFENRYIFPASYTETYMATALRLCIPILVNRHDLEDYMKYWLEHMVKCLQKEKQVEFIRKIAYVAP